MKILRFVELTLIVLIIITAFLIYVKPPKVVRQIKTTYKANQTKSNYKKEIKQHEQIVKKKTLSPYERLIRYRKLGELYRDGIPDKYDANNNKIKGLEPNAQNSIKYFTKAIELGDGESGIELGKLYHYGMHKFKPQLDKASKIYNELQYRIMDTHTRLKISELMDDLVSKQRADNVKNVGEVNMNNIVRPQPIMNQPLRQLRTQRPQRRLHRIQPRVVTRRRELDPKRNDTQNVHDSTVIRTIKKSINNLKKLVKINKDIPTTIKEVRELVNSQKNSDKKKDAVKALDTIERSTTTLSFSDIKEVDALNLVWNRIHSKDNKDNCDNLKDALVNELADCVEYDLPVCSTGRFNRIVDTLNVVDPAVTIKPTHVINSEMLSKASQIRKDFYGSYSDDDKKKIDQSEESLVKDTFSRELKNKIRAELFKDYVDSDIITKNKFESMVSSWIDHI